MLSLTADEYAALLRRNLYAFIARTFYELNPETEFKPNWHIAVIAAELEACWRGETTRLIINVPPRSLKSQAASVAFPAWPPGSEARRSDYLCQLRSGSGQQARN